MILDSMTALEAISNEQLEKKLKVWECDEYTWVLAANKKDANKVYLDYMKDCHGTNLSGIEVGLDGEFFILGIDVMRKYRYYPNEQDSETRTYLDEYDYQLAKDPTMPRLFAVGE